MALTKTLAMMPWLRPRSAKSEALLADRDGLRGASAADFAAMAQESLTPAQTQKLARAAQGLAGAGHRNSSLARLRVCIAAQATADFWLADFVVAGLRFGLLVDVVKTEFNQLAELAYGEFFSQGDGGVDMTFVALDARQIGFELEALLSAEQAEARVDSALATVGGILQGITARSGAPCIVQNLVGSSDGWVSSIDRSRPGTPEWLVARFNSRLPEILSAGGHNLFDAERLASEVGISRWHDRRMWNLAKTSPSQEVAPFYAHRLAAIVAAARGKSKKVLILDLDNTLWGGVVGDDGVEGIVLGQGSAAGEAFLNVQRMAVHLRSRGVVLAVCSKNDEQVARTAFEQHPEMLLKLDDFAVFVANWDDKATNIRAIAEALDLGFDSMVYLDDNPAEREIVRRNLPQVAVPELGDDPSDYSATVIAAGYFETVTLSGEDLQRARMYGENATRARRLASVGDMDAYLASLEMKLTIAPFDEAGRARIVQLINKSNQFNLTTRRYSAQEAAAAERDPEVLAIQVRLADCFGDNGMISVVICRPVEEGWFIDTWLMSCRVLKRRVEEQILQYLVARARLKAVPRLKGVFRPTGRNELVRDHYRNLGFAAGTSAGETEAVWWLDVAKYADKKLPFDVRIETSDNVSLA